MTAQRGYFQAVDELEELSNRSLNHTLQNSSCMNESDRVQYDGDLYANERDIVESEAERFHQEIQDWALKYDQGCTINSIKLEMTEHDSAIGGPLVERNSSCSIATRDCANLCCHKDYEEGE